LLGQLVKCPSCSHTFQAPESEEELVPVRQAAPPLRNEVEEDAPARTRRRPRYEEEDDFPARRRYPDDEYDEDRPRRRDDDRPDKAQAIAVMTLVGGILAVLLSVGFMASCIGFFWPGTYYSLVLGILAIIKGAQLLSQRARRETAPQATAIMQIVNIINLDFINLTLGIIILVFLGDREVKSYYRR
jgi:hypothetical protein